MRRWLPHVLALALLGSAGTGPVPAAEPEPLLLGEDDRLLVLAPHPDDETLAAGGLLQEALGLDLPVRVCFFTMGDNDEIAFLFTRRHPVSTPGAERAQGTLRQNEAIAAATQLGLGTNDLVFLGYPDAGTLDIWNHHWRTVPPYRSPLSRASAVPYDRVFTPGSAHAGEDILDDLVEVIRDFRPTHVVLPHPADHNVDHRALQLFARVALWDAAPDVPPPLLLAAPVHLTRWPEPRRHLPQRSAAPPAFLEGDAWREFGLAAFQVANKLAALRRHHSQFLHGAAYLQPFVRKSELFAVLPDLPFPGGVGAARLAEPDATQFRADPGLFAELALESDRWRDIADQNAAETADLGDLDNDFVAQDLAGDGLRLTLAFRFRKPVAPGAALVVSLFGHRADVPFGQMPKISIEVSPGQPAVVKDLGAKQPAETIALLPGGEAGIALAVPYALLGNPDRILVGAKLAKGRLPIDWTPWRVLDLTGASRPSAPASGSFPAPPAPGAELPPSAPAVPPAPPPPPAVALPEPPPVLAPRVNLPRKPVPEKTEANEPVMW